MAVAQEMAVSIVERHNAVPYAFQFSTRSRGPEDLDSREVAVSSLCYLGGKVETLEEVKARATERDRILISNMECNGYKRIITTTKGWRWSQPLNDNDIVLPDPTRTDSVPRAVEPPDVK